MRGPIGEAVPTVCFYPTLIVGMYRGWFSALGQLPTFSFGCMVRRTPICYTEADVGKTVIDYVKSITGRVRYLTYSVWLRSTTAMPPRRLACGAAPLTSRQVSANIFRGEFAARRD